MIASFLGIGPSQIVGVSASSLLFAAAVGAFLGVLAAGAVKSAFAWFMQVLAASKKLLDESAKK